MKQSHRLQLLFVFRQSISHNLASKCFKAVWHNLLGWCGPFTCTFTYSFFTLLCTSSIRNRRFQDESTLAMWMYAVKREDSIKYSEIETLNVSIRSQVCTNPNIYRFELSRFTLVGKSTSILRMRKRQRKMVWCIKNVIRSSSSGNKM